MSTKVAEAIELIKGMGDDEKLEFINQLVGNDLLNDVIEDVEDLLLYLSRRNEPAEDFEEFLNELRTEGRPV